MAKRTTMFFGPRIEPGEHEITSIIPPEGSRVPFAAGWVTDDGKLHTEPPPVRTRVRRLRD